jgi:hypothetical protein
MGLRDTIQNNSAVGITIAVVCLLIAGFIFFRGGESPTRGDWYYDLETGEVIVYDAKFDFPPVTLPNGHQGVQLNRFACGDCDSGEVFDGYLYKVTQAWIDAQKSDPSQQGPIAPNGGTLVAPVPTGGGEPRWFEQNSPQGVQILNIPRNKCADNDRPVMCLPR